MRSPRSLAPRRGHHSSWNEPLPCGATFLRNFLRARPRFSCAPAPSQRASSPSPNPLRVALLTSGLVSQGTFLRLWPLSCRPRSQFSPPGQSGTPEGTMPDTSIASCRKAPTSGPVALVVRPLWPLFIGSALPVESLFMVSLARNPRTFG